jgi:hypothetical protein
MRGAAGASLVAGVLQVLASPAARAADRCPASGAWVRVRFEGPAFEAPLQEHVAGQLAADLRGRRITPCAGDGEPDGGRAPLATITLALSAARTLTLADDDPLTHKRLEREVALAAVPADALAPAIALAAEELLRASWIEAALAPQPAPAPPVTDGPVPAEVRGINADEVERAQQASTAPSIELAVLAALDRSAGGLTGLGADLRLAWGDLWIATASLGLREGLDVARADGTVREHDVRAAIGAGVASGRHDAPLGATGRATLTVLDVAWSGDPAPGVTGASGSALGVVAGGAAGAWLALGPGWKVLAEASLGAALRPVTASDRGSAASGVCGIQLGAALGLAASL